MSCRCLLKLFVTALILGPTLALADEDEASTATLRTETKFIPVITPISFGTWIPSKHGIGLGIVLSPTETIEPEILRGSLGLELKAVDIVSFTETLYLLPLRWYPGDANSFNIRAGGGLRKYEGKIGSNLAGLPIPESSKFLDIESWILLIGLGNRWQFAPGFTFGIDWFELYVPILQGKYQSPSQRPDVAGHGIERVDQVLRFWPTMTFLKLQLGWAF